MPDAPVPSPMQVIRQAMADAEIVVGRKRRYFRLLEIATFFDAQSNQLVREAVELVNVDGIDAFRAQLADEPDKLAAFDAVVALIDSIRTLATQLTDTELPAMQDDSPIEPEPQPDEPV